MRYVKWMYVSIVFFLVLLPFVSFSQGGTWVWVRGSDTVNARVAYPTQGVSDSATNPLAVNNASSWIDLNGNFWVFGGIVGANAHDISGDLWRYNPVTNIWTWVKGSGVAFQYGIYGTQGVAASGNLPGSRSNGATWTDNSGNLWLFGGNGLAASQSPFGGPGNLNDLWKYNITTNEWTWMSGNKNIYYTDAATGDTDVYGILHQPSALNTPGARQGAATWIDDNDNLWLFGGTTEFQTDLPYNDMWKYNITANEWTWMSGPQHSQDTGYYGQLGIENLRNVPPPRSGAVSWRDTAGYFYLLGGGVYSDNNLHSSAYNDVWKYNPSENIWTWTGGDSMNKPAGNYVGYCVANSAVRPASKAYSGSCRILCQSNIALSFGGEYFKAGSDSTWVLNDLWLFDSKANNYKWISGATIPNDTANYGTIGIGSPTNIPSARLGSCQWRDNQGTLWVFGGSHSTTWHNQLYNDLWKFVPDTSCIHVPLTGGVYYSLSKNNLCKGDTSILTLTGDANIHISPNTSTSQIDSVHFLLYPDSTTIYILRGQSYCGINDSQSITISVHSNLNTQITASDTDFCKGDSVLLCAPYGYDTYLWSNGSTNSCLYTSQPGNYYLAVTEKPACTGKSDTVRIKFFDTLPVVVTQQGDTLIAQGETSYRWERDGIFISGALAATYIATLPGSYTVVSVDSIGCNTSSIPIVISDIQEIDASNVIIYPNPTEGKLIGYANSISIRAILQILASDGTVLLQDNLIQPNSFEINVTFLPAGIYFLEIQSENHKYIKKFVKK